MPRQYSLVWECLRFEFLICSLLSGLHVQSFDLLQSFIIQTCEFVFRDSRGGL